jgi:predicted amidohydrolase YtcJ
MRKIVIIAIVLFSLGLMTKENVDLLVYNATIYTVDADFSKAEAMVIRDGKIIDVGAKAELENKYNAKEKLDAGGKYIYPGFIDAHSHFFEYGFSLNEVNLDGTTSWDDVIDKVKTFAARKSTGWLRGRGWDQNDWPIMDFPTNDKLNELFPDRPVVLGRVDGHAVIANQKALDIAGIKAGDTISGGTIEVKNGKLTGILIDNAKNLVYSKMPGRTSGAAKEALLDAQQNCLAAGLTTVDDCGLNHSSVTFIDSLQHLGELKMRIYAMLSDNKSNYEFAFANGKIKTEKLHVCAFKVYADGALGSRGACLLQPYDDKPGWSGFLLNTISHYDSVANILSQKGWQMCTHAIGDSGNRMILHVYAKYLKGKNDLRWRVEHSQVVNEADFKLFGEYNIIPSVQPTHATSDMYWVGDRLGKERVKGAYAYKRLLDENGWIPLGTDFPVEDISPIKTFYAAVVRKDAKGYPENGFQTENALSRESTLRGITIWPAKANFEEEEKGSLEKGKYADFIVLDNDLMTTSPDKILTIKVMMTYLGGEKLYERK